MTSADKRFTIGEFAKLTGVTERTLRFYDKKSLLKPSGYSEQGHRLYAGKDIVTLQKILTLKYLDYSLEEIAQSMQQPEVDLKSSLAFQHTLLQKKREHLDKVIETLNRVQNIMQETESIETDYLLLVIYMLQQEEKQKEWLLQRISKSTVDALFLEGRPPEERLEFERKTVAILAELKKMGKEGMAPDDPIVQKKGGELLQLLTSAVQSEALEEVSRQIDENDLNDPFLFPNIFLEDEIFIQQVFNTLNPSLMNLVNDSAANEKASKTDDGQEESCHAKSDRKPF